MSYEKEFTFLFCLWRRANLEHQLQEYEREQQMSAPYVEQFALLTSEKVPYKGSDQPCEDSEGYFSSLKLTFRICRGRNLRFCPKTKKQCNVIHTYANMFSKLKSC
jgi:hypothetical protein